MINRTDNIDETIKDVVYVAAKIFDMKIFKGNVDENFDKEILTKIKNYDKFKCK
mgnify:CR=1 FL=1